MKQLFSLESSKSGCNWLRKLELAQDDNGQWFSRNNHETGMMQKWSKVQVTEFEVIQPMCTRTKQVIECRVDAGYKQRLESYPLTLALPKYRLPK